VQIAGDTKFEFLAVVRRTPAVPPSRLAEPESRIKAIAAAQEDSQAIERTANADDVASVRRSFLETERPTAESAGQIPATAQNASPDPADLRRAEVQPANVSSLDSGRLKATATDTVVQGRPAAMRPVVRFEQKGGVSNHWNVIYHNMAQDRPTQSQTAPPESSPVAVEAETQSTAPVSPPQESSARPPSDKKRGERDDRSQ